MNIMKDGVEETVWRGGYSIGVARASGRPVGPGLVDIGGFME